MRFHLTVLLGLLPLAATAALPTPLQPLQTPVADIEALQWISTPLWPKAQLLVAGGQELALLDGQGQRLAQYLGHFGSLDQRSDDHRLLISLTDEGRQQPLLLQWTPNQQWSQPHYLPQRPFVVETQCLFRDDTGHDFLFLVGEEGFGEQWLVGQPSGLVTPQLVRTLSLPPASEHCQVDDSRQQLYVSEDNVGIWAYPAAAEAPLQRRPVALVQPFGQLQNTPTGLALADDQLWVLDGTQLQRYQHQGEHWLPLHPHPLEPMADLEQLTVRKGGEQLHFSLLSEGRLLQGQQSMESAEAHFPQPSSLPRIPVRVQSEVVPSQGDAADDPAIWVHPKTPAHSRILGTDKRSGLLVYDLQGQQQQFLPVGRLNNVDLRQHFRLGAQQIDLAVASHRDHNSLQFFAIDPNSGQVQTLGQWPTPLKEIYGLCLFQDPDSHQLYALPNDKDGRVLQYRLDGSSGQVQAELVRQFQLPSQPEGCVADDRHHRLFIGEEDAAVWTLDARPEHPPALQPVITAGDLLQPDIEGLALYQGQQGHYLVISSQGNDSYLVLDALPPYQYRGAFRLTLNATAGVDGASETDGLEVTAANLGSPWQQGLLVVQDGRNRLPQANQNFKYAAWADIARALNLAP